MNVVSVQLDEAILTKLDALARQTQCSRDLIVTSAIEAYLDLAAWQDARIAEGIAAADRGDFVSEKEINSLLSRYDAAP